jgi:hypothetical protein
VIRLTPARAKALVETLSAELARTHDDPDDSGLQFVVQLTAFPLPGHVT